MTNKRILITGATSGIGMALAKHCHQQDYSVIACGRNQDKLQELEQQGLQTLRFDVTDREATEQALAAAQADIWVLNAGTCEYVDVEAFDAKMFDRVFAPNFFGVVNCFQAISSKLQAGQQVVIIDSLARLLPFTRSQAYGASKAALYYFTKSLETDLGRKGVLIQSVSPGFIETPLTDKNDFEMPMKIPADEAAQALLRGIERGRKNIYFPRLFSFFIQILALLPINLQVALCRRMTGQQKT